MHSFTGITGFMAILLPTIKPRLDAKTMKTIKTDRRGKKTVQ